MSEREFELYLSLMSKLLRLNPEQTASISDELRDHFDERFEDLCRQGVPREQAIRQALDDFGDAAGLASDFTQLARTRRRRMIMRFTLATVFLAAATLFIVQALTPPNPIVNGPALALAQDEPSVSEPLVVTIEFLPAATPTTIDPATLVPPPLAMKLDWEFTDLPLNEMIEEFSSRIEMPVHIRESQLNDAGIPVDESVSGSLHDLPAYLLLDRIGVRYNLCWFVDDGILNVTSQDFADETRTLRSHVFSDLRDGGYAPDDLIELLQTTTEGPWKEMDGIGGTLSVVGDVLFVRQTERNHREVSGLLKALRGRSRECYIIDPPIHQRIREQLDHPLSVEFDEVPLATAVDWLATETGLNIEIDEEQLADAGISPDEPVSLVLHDRPLHTVLKYLVRHLDLTAIPQDGRLLVTTSDSADENMLTVVHDVSDVCETKEETEQLVDVIIHETKGPWEQLHGIGGVVSIPIAGIMAVRQTEKALQEVRDLLAAYRQARTISKSPINYGVELKKLETRYYLMNADMANDLQNQLPFLIQPGTWPLMGHDNESEKIVGRISMIATDPRIETLPGRDVSGKTKRKKPDDEDDPTEDKQPDVLVIPQAVLIIKHTKATHREIERMLRQVSQNRVVYWPQGGGGGRFFGGGGGGFFQIPTHSADR